MAIVRLHFRLSKDLKAQLDDSVKRDGYGPRGKSRWIRESLLAMEDHDKEMKYIGQGDLVDGPPKISELFTVPSEIDSLLDDMLLRLRICEPATNVDRSILLRSAIRFRLRNSHLFPGKPSSSSKGRSTQMKRVVQQPLPPGRHSRKTVQGE